MKKSNLILSLSVGILILSSCENGTKKIDSKTQVEHHHEENSTEISLNNGEKWIINVEMMPPIKKMEAQINAFSKTDLTSYISLSDSLQENLNILTSSCTMSGKAHDELHKWLVPYMDLVTELAESETESQAKTTFTEIKTSISQFNTYFK